MEDKVLYEWKVTGASDPEIIMALMEEWPNNGFLIDQDTIYAYFYNRTAEDVVHMPEEWQKHIVNVEVKKVENTNWNEKWESSFEPVEIENFCRIYADFHKPNDEILFNIQITPKMSFGTGHHETTVMMICAMSRLYMEGKTVLDFGTGTGILAILSSFMGAKQVVANEIEEIAVENAHENIDNNLCANIELIHGNIDHVPQLEYDLILANVNRNVLLNDAHKLFQLQNSKGILLISGILDKDNKTIRDAFELQNYRFLSEWQEGHWVCQKYIK